MTKFDVGKIYVNLFTGEECYCTRVDRDHVWMMKAASGVPTSYRRALVSPMFAKRDTKTDLCNIKIDPRDMIPDPRYREDEKLSHPKFTREHMTNCNLSGCDCSKL